MLKWNSLIWAFFICAAQPLPDTVFFIQPSGDTNLITTYQVFPRGWSANIYKAERNSWKLVELDSIFLDSILRVSVLLRYKDTSTTDASVPIPYEKVEFFYPYSGFLIFTKAIYHPSYRIFFPYQRVYLWSYLSRWDSAFSGWFGLLGLGWNFHEGAGIWPFPALIHRTEWGDSLLLENFDSLYNIFLEAGGYFHYASSFSCDSLLIYESPRRSMLIRGYYLLCTGNEGKLAVHADSMCGPAQCIARNRYLSYEVGGKLIADSSYYRFYNSQGNLLGQVEEKRYFFWDTEGKLIEAHYPAGKYKIRYGGQVVALSSPASPASLLSCGRKGQIRGGQKGDRIFLYEISGRKIWEGQLEEEGRFELPDYLPFQLYFLRWKERAWKCVIFPD
ncbi:MAG: hypothetical protein RMJ66_06450 [Bacteroidia bacterium]|nr:hypothetical protein [Bacteroidia bacterium]MDW8134692.1 hypothetical protein [Bacteroidia bacterium]